MEISKTARRGLIWILLMAAGTACWAQGRVLHQKYQEGETRSYRVVLDLEFSGDLIPGGKSLIHEERVQHWNVRKVFPDGSAEVLITHSDVQLKIDGEEVPVSANDGLSFVGMPLDVPLVQTFTKIGALRDIKPVKELRPSQRAKAESLFEMLKNVKAAWPEGKVNPGHTWKSEVVVSQDAPGVGSIDIAIDITSTFAGLETCGGVECLKVTAVGSGSGAMGEGVGSLKMNTATTTLIDALTGRLVKHVDRWEVNMVIVTESGEKELLESFEQILALESAAPTGGGEEGS